MLHSTKTYIFFILNPAALPHWDSFLGLSSVFIGKLKEFFVQVTQREVYQYKHFDVACFWLLNIYYYTDK